jgi:NAD+ kinase
VTTTLKRIGVLAHPTRPQTASLAEQIAQSLQAQGVETWVYTQWNAETVVGHMGATDMVIAIGGDGAMLHSARVCAPYSVPVLGINTGHLGFLTEIDGLDNLQTGLDEVLAGHYWIEQRMMLHVTVERDGATVAAGEALNEAVIGSGGATRMVQVDAFIDGEWTTKYNADALIIATATGSTAYALAAGGPILPPELRNLLLVPVAPHLSLDRPIVLPEGATVTGVVSPEAISKAVLTVDGDLLAELQPNDNVCVQASQNVSRFVRLRGPMYFYRSLLDRLEPRISSPSLAARRQVQS